MIYKVFYVQNFQLYTLSQVESPKASHKIGSRCYIGTFFVHQLSWQERIWILETDNINVDMIKLYQDSTLAQQSGQSEYLSFFHKLSYLNQIRILG